ncbi:MAG: dihydroxyacetone kinase subunit L [Desulfovibrionales bacterium]|nr:dihydroxyacetone kinase subunit L [Desulfovibrionales bacterium]
MFTKAHVRDWFEQAYSLLQEHQDELTALDTAIGDGDHGMNMVRGFEALTGKLSELESKPLSQMLKEAGMVLLSSVGGVSGPLYGTFFLKGSEQVGDDESVDADGLYDFLVSGLKGLRARGRTELNDKTMVDALFPAIEAYGNAVNGGETMAEALDSAVQAADYGMKATIPLIARKGRASYLGERSIGHQDPGATSSYYILKALKQSIGG